MSGSAGSWKPGNMALARAYWYIIAGVLGLLLVKRGINYYQGRLRYGARCSVPTMRQLSLPSNFKQLTFCLGFAHALPPQDSFPQSPAMPFWKPGPLLRLCVVR